MGKNPYFPVTLLAALAVVAACGGTQAASSPPHPATAAATARTPVREPDPNATESSPPGDIPDDTAFVPYRGRLYEIKVPEGWARTTTPSAVRFTDKLNTLTITVRRRSTAPTLEAAKVQEVAELQAAGGDFALTAINTLTRAGGRAVRIAYQVDSAPNPVTGKVIREDAERYDFHRDAQEAVLTLSGPAGSDNADPWRTISDSFRWRP
ncbi:hypothetical protein [Streptosporangium sp. V21-05]|uniref:hypothetical protein n=1 Tax=Streptosporangium sp. V21-05 TaxID=3446115 RepID=UPI003F5371B4